MTVIIVLLLGVTVTCASAGAFWRSVKLHLVGRIVAICRAAHEDLGAIMVREGLACAFVRCSGDYVSQDVKAVGVHAHDCQPVWEWRA